MNQQQQTLPYIAQWMVPLALQQWNQTNKKWPEDNILPVSTNPPYMHSERIFSTRDPTFVARGVTTRIVNSALPQHRQLRPPFLTNEGLKCNNGMKLKDIPMRSEG